MQLFSVGISPKQLLLVGCRPHSTTWLSPAALGPLVRLSARVQILLSFYQVATVIDSTYSTELPEFYTDWTHQFEVLGALDWGKLTGISTRCLMGDFEQQMVVKVSTTAIAHPSSIWLLDPRPSFSTIPLDPPPER